MLRSGNRIALLRNGAQYFPALIAALDAARDEIHFESYLFEADATGRAVAAALAGASRRGVRVHLVLDGFGAAHLDPHLGADLAVAGVQALFYRPLPRWPGLRRAHLHLSRLRRMHRKLVVIDARVAFVGGINVIDDSNAPGRPDHRYDYAVRIEGPLLADIHPVAARMWRLLRWHRLDHRLPARPAIGIDAAVRGAQSAQFLIRDIWRHRRDIEDAYLAAIRGARREIVIANAYFLPGRRLRHALVEAAGRGVRVILLLQGRADHPFVRLASRALYRHFLEQGVEIREYHASFMHAKVAVVDGVWATVGSSNIDPFSLWLSYEANVVVIDTGFAGQLRADLEETMRRGSHAIRRIAWRRVGRVSRFVSWLAYGVVRWLVALVDRNGEG